MTGRLYPDFKPIGINGAWEHTSMTVGNSGAVLRQHGIDAAWGDPVEAVAWFAEVQLRVLVADYANGRRVTLRKNRSGYRLEVVTPEPSSALQRTEKA